MKEQNTLNNKRQISLKRASKLKSRITDYIEVKDKIPKGMDLKEEFKQAKNRILKIFNATEEDWEDYKHLGFYNSLKRILKKIQNETLKQQIFSKIGTKYINEAFQVKARFKEFMLKFANKEFFLLEDSNNKYFKEWYTEGQKKVVLKVEDLDNLLKIFNEAKSVGLTTELIKDAGLTEIHPGTITVLGIGPAPENEIDKIVGNLKLL